MPGTGPSRSPGFLTVPRPLAIEPGSSRGPCGPSPPALVSHALASAPATPATPASSSRCAPSGLRWLLLRPRRSFPGRLLGPWAQPPSMQPVLTPLKSLNGAHMHVHTQPHPCRPPRSLLVLMVPWPLAPAVLLTARCVVSVPPPDRGWDPVRHSMKTYRLSRGIFTITIGGKSLPSLYRQGN